MHLLNDDASAAVLSLIFLVNFSVANTNGLATLIVRLPSTSMTTENSAVEDAKLTSGKNMQIRENNAEQYRKIENGEEAESKLKY